MNLSIRIILVSIALIQLTTISAYCSFQGTKLANSNNYSDAGKWTMKKGKPNVPPMMRTAYKRNQDLNAQRQAMQAATQYDPKDGFPVFNLFVRTTTANMWYPAGNFKGDERSAALAKSYADNGILAGISKSQLDKGVSGSLFRDVGQLKQSLIRGYPQLKGKDLEFGYKLSFEGLSEEQSKTQLIEVKESKGFFEGLFGK